MIEPVSGLPDNVVGVRVSGTVTGVEYESVLIPAVDAALKAHKKVRIYYEVGPDFHGFTASAAVDDMMMGLRHFSAWDRVAFVTDNPWLTHAVQAFRFMMPCPLRHFPLAEAADAKTWVAES